MRKGKTANTVDNRISATIRPKSLRKYGELTGRCPADNGSDCPTMAIMLSELEFVLELQEAHTYNSLYIDQIVKEMQDDDEDSMEDGDNVQKSGVEVESDKLIDTNTMEKVDGMELDKEEIREVDAKNSDLPKGGAL
jgi:hypothetical protein